MNRGLDYTCYPWLAVKFQFWNLFNRNVLVYNNILVIILHVWKAIFDGSRSCWKSTCQSCHDSSFCEYRGGKHLLVLSIIFSSIGKKSLTQLHCLKALFTLLMAWRTLLVYTAKNHTIWLLWTCLKSDRIDILTRCWRLWISSH